MRALKVKMLIAILVLAVLTFLIVWPPMAEQIAQYNHLKSLTRSIA